jgi:hypothetical protein
MSPRPIFAVILILTFTVLAVSGAQGANMTFYSPLEASTDLDFHDADSSGVTYTTGKYGNGIFIDSTDTVDIPAEGKISKDKGTISLWLKPTWSGSANANYRTLIYWIGSDSSYMHLYIYAIAEDTSLVVWKIKDKNGVKRSVETTSVRSWDANTWHYIQASWDFRTGTKKLCLITDSDTPVIKSTTFNWNVTMEENLHLGYQTSNNQPSAVIDELCISDAYAATKSRLVFNESFQNGATVGNNNGTPNSVTYEARHPSNAWALCDATDTLTYPLRADENFASTTKGMVEFWVKPTWDGDETTEHHYFLSWTNTPSFMRIYTFYNGTKSFLVFKMADTNGVQSVIDTNTEEDGNNPVVMDWKAGEWHHIRAYWDLENGHMALEVDGGETHSEEVDITESRSVSYPTTFYVGSYTSGGYQADAVIDDLRIYNDTPENLTGSDVFNTTPVAISTFHSIGLYWSPAAGSNSNDCDVQYRKLGESTWNDALDLWWDARDHQYRGSIVHVKPNTQYEVKLALDTGGSYTVLTKTWSEEFPIAQTIEVDNRTTRLTLTNIKGSPNGYILYKPSTGGGTIDLGGNDSTALYMSGCSYVIIRGLTLTDSTGQGIQIQNNSHDIVIEDCSIDDYGQSVTGGWGHNNDSAIFTGNGDMKRIIIQRNKMGTPKYSANTWDQWNEANSSYHPSGPHAVKFANTAYDSAQIVIRYNEVTSDADHLYNDFFYGSPNFSYTGFPNRDSDIYGNYCEWSADDGVEAEGANMNVRIFGNYLEKTFCPIATMSTSIGPVYIFRNTSAYELPTTTLNSRFIKWGGHEPYDIWYGDGMHYVINNTALQPGTNEGCEEGPRNTANSGENWALIKNNICQVPSTANVSVKIAAPDSSTLDVDYNLSNGIVFVGSSTYTESNGIVGTPSYLNSSDILWDATSGVADTRLATTSNGYDDGVAIPNFTDVFNYGGAPDMGAAENGAGLMVYGVNAAEFYDTVWIKGEVATPSLPNKSFETDPTVDYANEGTGTFTHASDESNTGTYSVKIVRTTTTSYGAWKIDETIQPGRKYTGTAYVKTSGATGLGACMKFQYLDRDGTQLAKHQSSWVTATTWGQISMTHTAPAKAVALRVSIRFYGVGTCWYDDINLTVEAGN